MNAHATAIATPRSGDFAHALAVLISGGVAIGLRAPLLATAVGAAFLVRFVAMHRGRFTDGGALGAANAVTLARLALILLLGALGPREAGAMLAIVVLTIFVLDGVDGWLARRLGLASPFGARLDMECDALLVLTCALLLHASGRLPLFILVPGLLRYVYVLVCSSWPRGVYEAPSSNIGRYVFSATVLSFAASLWPVPGHQAAALMASLLMVWSFWRSFAFSLRTRVA